MSTELRVRKYTIEDRGDTLLISIPIPKVWFALLPWGGMVVASLCMVASGEPVYVAGFSVFGILLIIWNFLRKEVVEVSTQSIAIWDEVLGIRLRTKRYLTVDIRELRVSQVTPMGLVAFDYGSATVAFGKGLDPTAANEIVAVIKRRLMHDQQDDRSLRVQPERSFNDTPSSKREVSMGISAPLPRHKSEVLGNKLRITVPSVKQWSRIIFLAFWLLIWSYGGIYVVRAVILGRGGVFLILFSVFWVIFEIVSVYHLLWLLFGREEIEISADSMAIRQAILGVGRTKVYAKEHISRMGTDVAGSKKPYPLASEGISISKGTGVIAFAYKQTTVRMGISLDEAEAKELIAEIQRQYPQYSK